MNDEYNMFHLFLFKSGKTTNISLRDANGNVTAEDLELMTKCMIEHCANQSPDMLCRLRRYIKHGKGERIIQLKREFYESVDKDEIAGSN